MDNFDLDVLKALYQKIKNNTATSKERANFELLIKRSCMNEQLLIKMIEGN